MSDHYFSSRPSSPHEERKIQDQLRGRSLTFLTDAGVFSKGGIDFGSRLLIETMDIPDKATVLEVGCGYGPIGLTAALLADKGHVDMVDVNQRAIELTRRNAEANGISNVEVFRSDVYEAVSGKRYDRILSNPPIRAGKVVVHQILEEAHHHLNKRGEMWIVIQKKQGAPSAMKKLESLFQDVAIVEKESGYQIIRSRNPFLFDTGIGM